MKKIGREKKDKKWVENIILKVSGRNKKKKWVKKLGGENWWKNNIKIGEKRWVEKV